MSNSFLLKKKPFTRGAQYDGRMEDISQTRRSLARNLRILKEMADPPLSEKAIAERASQFLPGLDTISQKSVNNMLNMRHSPNLDDVDAVAQVFGLTGWHLIMPNLPDDLVKSDDIRKLVEGYIQLPPKSREFVGLVVNREGDKTTDEEGGNDEKDGGGRGNSGVGGVRRR